ncbi:hypothetical protein VIGAN_06085300 [Vigna angularis var. angularis]|uniref:Uncharacterized protein n=1 Tax=Vigna angularis var. angularis TaxID=157739 RepID=A0A0S3SAG9_PHAAN|nr:hypothetical protein VIGAN_06085300 [Vigna angularis var. angularis]
MYFGTTYDDENLANLYIYAQKDDWAVWTTNKEQFVDINFVVLALNHSGAAGENELQHILVEDYQNIVFVSNENESYITLRSSDEDLTKWTLLSTGQLINRNGGDVARADLCYTTQVEGAKHGRIYPIAEVLVMHLNWSKVMPILTWT